MALPIVPKAGQRSPGRRVVWFVPQIAHTLAKLGLSWSFELLAPEQSRVAIPSETLQLLKQIRGSGRLPPSLITTYTFSGQVDKSVVTELWLSTSVIEGN